MCAVLVFNFGMFYFKPTSIHVLQHWKALYHLVSQLPLYSSSLTVHSLVLLKPFFLRTIDVPSRQHVSRAGVSQGEDTPAKLKFPCVCVTSKYIQRPISIPLLIYCQWAFQSTILYKRSLPSHRRRANQQRNRAPAQKKQGGGT